MRVLVCGGRDYKDFDAVYQALDTINCNTPIDVVIAGGATGADSMAESWAESRGVHCAVVKPMWKRYGKGDGPRRNRAMLALLPVLVVAFPGGNGTADMCNAAADSGVKVWWPDGKP